MLTVNRIRFESDVLFWLLRRFCFGVAAILFLPSRAFTQESGAMAQCDESSIIQSFRQTIQELQDELRELKSTVAKLSHGGIAQSPSAAAGSSTNPTTLPSRPFLPGEEIPEGQTSQIDVQEAAKSSSMEHAMELPFGGPELKLRGFFDVNLGLGSDANPLIYPLGAPAHNTFQLGEFDLFITSKLSDSLSFLSETVIGSDATNNWGLDIERAQLTYHVNDYFEVSAGRFHTAIGYYNTAFHHGAWFQTATGRPFMYFFEDSGGILPVHSVGVNATGLVPHTGGLRLHWIAEVSNGEGSSFFSQPSSVSPVQNFLSDKNHKAFNFASYVRPVWAAGLQIGGSFYTDRLVPAGVPHVDQTISSAYVIYTTADWELLNEAVLLRDKSDGSAHTFNTPLTYTQISRKFGNFRPYFRYQFVNVPHGDPLWPNIGRYQGPSPGLRMDFTDFAALKVQYNRLYTGISAPKNGVDTQLAFTF